MTDGMLEVEMLRLMQKHPFYCNILQKLERRWDPSCPSAGVYQDKTKMFLLINKDWFYTFNQVDRVQILCHEVLHLVFRHTLRLIKNTLLQNLAADLVVNQHITRSEEMKENGIIHIEDLDFPANLTVMEYEELLKKFANEINQALENQGGSSEGKKEGEGTGEEDKNEDSDDNQQKPDRGENNAHSYLPEGFEADENLQNQMVQKIVKEALKETNPGNVPGSLEDAIKKLMEPPRIPWQQHLRQFVGYSKRIRPTVNRHKPNRRFGMVYPGKKFEQLNKILAVVDTSGSMSNEQLSYIFNELLALTKKDVEVTVMNVDTEIQDVYEIRTPHDLKFSVKGRGGTEFQDVFPYARKHKFQDLLIFTDLYVHIDAQWGSNLRVLWVVPSREYEQQVLFGKCISIL